MPGILPMKVIKIGAQSQTRIAQACDRCRSKKIRCDGVRPCCSQCANVGFECKTSDKLSRRAFPRGYTESLEERVRGLESEVRELKDLLDEKDEKIDMLSRIHLHSSQPVQLPSPRRPSTTSVESVSGRTDTPTKDEVFKVQQSPDLLQEDGSDSYFSGTSSARTFVEAFKHRVQKSGRSTADIDTALLLASGPQKAPERPITPPKSPLIVKGPPRLLSDQLVNIFFQEWSPLFPVLHRPTFLSLYNKYVEDYESITDKAEIAQLNLVFGIASLSNHTKSSPDHATIESFESQWKAALDAILTENFMPTLQSLILAQIFCVLQGDLTRLLTYKGLSTSLSTRLGLHQSQERFALGTLTCETRKKVFWTLYTVDSFTAVSLGLPKQIKDDDVHCEYPVDADDEYLSETGFQPALPGESTKLSSALALFRASRILSKVLEEVFPAKASYDLSLKRLSELSDELDAWNYSLAPHLRLQFVQDKPSTGTISSRSPLLSFTYHYIRALLQRPVLCASLGAKESSHLITMAGACKSMIQIVQLLEERGLSFSLCLSRDEILVVCGFGLLFQGLGLDRNSKLLKDNAKMIAAITGILNKSSAPCAAEFERVAKSFVPTLQSKPKPSTLSKPTPDGAAPTISQPSSTRKQQLKAIASRIASGNAFKPKLDGSDGNRRATVHNISLHPHSPQTQSVPSLQPPVQSITNMSRSEPARSPVALFSRPNSTVSTRATTTPPKSKAALPTYTPPNLDYLSFDNGKGAAQPRNHTTATAPVKTEPSPADWEQLIGSLDSGEPDIYDVNYGGASIDGLLGSPLGMHHNNSSPAITDPTICWNADFWTMCPTTTETSTGTTDAAGMAGSTLSFSTDEGGSSGEDFTADWASASSAGSNGNDAFSGIVIPFPEGDDLGFAEGWDTNLKL